MSVRKPELRVTTANVKNPDFDRRNRHGCKAVDEVPQGTKFLYWPQRSETTDDGVWTDPPSARIRAGFTPPALTRALEENSVVTQPETADEVITALDARGCADLIAIRALQLLVDRGQLTMAECEALMRAAHDQEFA